VRRTFALAAVITLGVSVAPATALAVSASGGHARALAEAKAVLADAPQLSSATPSATAPVKRLASSPESAGYTEVVMVAKFWTVNEPEKQAFAELTASTPAGYGDSGSGGTSGPKPSDTVDFESYEPNSLPAGIAYANLVVAVTPTGKNTSAIGAYGQAVPQPPRPAAENVPTSVHTVKVGETNLNKKHPIQRTVTGPKAAALVKAFDALTVAPPSGPRPCPEDSITDTATFRSHGNVWVASSGPCDGIAVVRDGKALPGLNGTPAWTRALNRALHPGTHRPKAEQVPTSVHRAQLAYRTEPFNPPTRRRTVTGKQAKTLVTDFNSLRRQPKHYLTCDIAGGPQTTVTFRTPNHTWVATQSACTNIVVTRDGKALPTLLSSEKWENAVQRFLGN
jgi:hypothetical protein